MGTPKRVVAGVLAGVVSARVSGCVTLPCAIRGVRATPQEDLVRVMNAPQLSVGQESRFGGKVVKVDNQKGKTRLEIAAVPLDSGARPILGEASIGRIFAEVKGFIDSVDFQDKLVTVVGPISGVHEGPVGGAPYRFLVVSAEGYTRWHLARRVVLPPAPMDPWMMGPHPWRYGYGGWGWYNPGPAQVQSVVTE